MINNPKNNKSMQVQFGLAMLKPLALAGTVALLWGGMAGPAGAAELAANDPGATELTQSGVSPVPGTPSPAVVTQLPPAVNPYAKADELKVRGWIIPLPGAADTLDQGAFGLRNALAEKGISYLVIQSTSFFDNLIRHSLPAGRIRENQLYNGQLPTYSATTGAYVMYDLRRYGIPDGQIVVGGYQISTNWNPIGPNGNVLATASYYQTLFNKRVEIKVGYFGNTYEYLGTYVGGSLASGVFGPNAALPQENGENSNAYPGLGANVRVNLPANFYTKFGVQRAISPDGTAVERLQNPTGANLKVSNAGVFAIDELGYRTVPAPGQPSTWIRGAATYTSSRYTELLNPAVRRSPNFGLYLLADRQILQTAPNAAPGSAGRGLYAGFSVMYTPSYFNRFSQYYEGRLYGVGLIPGRPFDLVSLVATRNVFSEDGVRVARARGLLAHDDTNAVTFSYGYRVIPGVTFNAGVQYTDHPTVITYTRSTGSALNLLLNLTTFL